MAVRPLVEVMSLQALGLLFSSVISRLEVISKAVKACIKGIKRRTENWALGRRGKQPRRLRTMVIDKGGTAGDGSILFVFNFFLTVTECFLGA